MGTDLSPEQMITLGKALNRIIEKFGPFNSTQKEAIAASLLRLVEDCVSDLDRLVELATPPDKRN